MRFFHASLEPLVGAVHVAEVRLAAGLGDDLAVDDRRLAGDAPPRAVGVPVQRPLVGVLAVGLAVGVEVGEPVQLGKAVGVVHRHHVHLHLAELARERDLRRRRQVVRREDEHLVAQEGVVEGAKVVGRDAAREVEAGDLGAEARRQRADAERRLGSGEGMHGRTSLESVQGQMNPEPPGALKQPTDSGRNCFGSQSTMSGNRTTKAIVSRKTT